MLLGTLGCTYLFKLVFLWFSDMYPEVEMLSHTVVLILVSSETSMLSSTVAAPIYIPINSICGSVEVEMLSHTVVLILVSSETSMLSSTVAAPIYIPINSICGSLFSTSTPTFVICFLSDDSHSDRCEVISNCFNLYFPDY